MKFHLQVDNENIIWPAMGGNAAAHAQDWVRARGNHDLTEHIFEPRSRRAFQESHPADADQFFDAVSGTLKRTPI